MPGVRHGDVQPTTGCGCRSQRPQHRVGVDQVLQHVVAADRVPGPLVRRSRHCSTGPTASSSSSPAATAAACGLISMPGSRWLPPHGARAPRRPRRSPHRVPARAGGAAPRRGLRDAGRSSRGLLTDHGAAVVADVFARRGGRAARTAPGVGPMQVRRLSRIGSRSSPPTGSTLICMVVTEPSSIARGAPPRFVARLYAEERRGWNDVGTRARRSLVLGLVQGRGLRPGADVHTKLEGRSAVTAGRSICATASRSKDPRCVNV